MARRLRETIRNPMAWECNCAESCWCRTTRWGHWLMYYIPPRFHRFPPTASAGAATRSRRSG